MTRKPSILLILVTLFFIHNQAGAQGYLHAQGNLIHDGNGNEVLLRGIGTGNWMLNEGYMMKSDDFAGTHTQYRDLVAQTIGEANTEIFYETWLNNHFTRQDADSMKAWGFNSVRVAMHYKWFTLPAWEEPVQGQDTWFEEGFVRIDSLLDWCGDNGMYLVLDLHGAPGGQGHDRNISDYDPAYPSLWESAENRRKTVAIWRKLAERYAGEPWIGGYDLINEPNWDLPGGTLLKQTYVDITNAIREVDQDHMIIIEGNWFANDYTGLTPPWDDNMVYSFHKYWNFNNTASIQWMIDLRNTYNVPVWLGETGENSNSWFCDAIRIAEQNKIGWSWWPVKKAGINNVLMVPESLLYNQLLSYWKTGSPVMTQQQAFDALMDWADKHRIENCSVQRDVLDAMLRQPKSNETIPFKHHDISGAINLVNYDIGKCSFSYWDADTANYHVSTGIYTDWNHGWAYRNDGVDIERCYDAFTGTNGYNVGWTEAGEWMEFTVVSDSAAAYQVLLRSASPGDPAKVHLRVNGYDACPARQLPTTGNTQAWNSTFIEEVIVPAGTNKIRLVIDKGGSNLNLLRFQNPVPVTSVAFTFISAETNTEGSAVHVTLNKPVTVMTATGQDFEVQADGITIPVTKVILSGQGGMQLILGLETPVRYGQTVTISYSGASVFSNDQGLGMFSGKEAKNNLPKRFVIPVRIQAEDFETNSGYQLETCTDAGGGQNLSYANDGDYADYLVSVPEAGKYEFKFRVASLYWNGSFSVRLGNDGVFTPLKSVSVNGTGGWQTWTTQSVIIDLPQGNYTLRLYSLSGEYNINWFEISLFSGLNDIPGLKDFRLYPNPSGGCFSVSAEFSSTTPVTLSILDLRGKEIYNWNSGPVTVLDHRIEYPETPSGVYFLCLSTQSGQLLRKIILI